MIYLSGLHTVLHIWKNTKSFFLSLKVKKKMGKDLDIADPLQIKEFPLLNQIAISEVILDSKADSKRTEFLILK